MLLLLETAPLDYLVHYLPGAPPERAAPPLCRGRPVRGLGEALGGRGLGEHALLGPLPLGLHEARARQAQHRLPRGEGLHDPVAALDLAVGALLDVVGAELGPVRPGEGRERQRGVLGLLEDLAGPGGHRRHPGRRLGPHAAREVGVVLVDRGVHELPDGRLGVLGPARAGALEVALQVRHAALPGAALEQARDGGHEPGVAVGDHEANAGQPALAQPAEECRPGVLALGVDHVAAQEVLAPVGAQPDRGHDALRDDRRADPAAHVGGVEPQVAARRAREVAAAELRHLGVEVGAEARDLRARQRGYAQLGRHALDLAGGHAAHVHLLHDGGHRGVDARPSREHALGVVGAVPELGYLELHVAHGGLERPGAVAVAAVLPAVAALVAARAAHLLGLGVHQRVHHAAQHPARELARVAALLPKPRRLEGLVAAEAQYTLFLGHRLSFHSSPSLLQRRILGGVPSLSRKRRGGACPASYTTSLRATLKDSGKWYWLDGSGAMATGARTIDGVRRIFWSDGQCDKVGWQNPPQYPQVSSWTVQLPSYCTGYFTYVTPSRISVEATREDCVNAFIQRAYEYIGTQYIEPWSTAPGGAVDCSGFVLQCLYATGMDMGVYNPYNHRWDPSQTYNSMNWYRSNIFMPVSTSSIQRGDVIYYRGHIAIALGGGLMIDSWPHQGVGIHPVSARGNVIGAARPFI